MSNITNIMVIFSSKDLRRRYVYLAAFNVCEMVNAISFILVGLGRGYENIAGTLFTPGTVHRCFTEKYWPHLLILGTEMMAYSMILISCERFFAVLRPVKYKIIFEDRNKIYFLFLIPLATLQQAVACEGSLPQLHLLFQLLLVVGY
ncbi:unnamed protein product [Heligmosomoides polygyrus]|uniref:7TM_GPCR_Srx domain-containing protein n=1 Tax=Heligmosomoides polygyrus TaxID=6339 RepID=A0A183GCX5_HELPZ|nr:unnamed protein product [Heligmosomoides polygyrus]